MKKIIVACGGAVATSTVAANLIRELAKKHQIDAEVVQYRISELESQKEGADLIVTTGRFKKDIGIPVLQGTAFISGIGVEALEEKILAVIKD
jgi:PTS system galactitol-specific IIB component